MNYSKDFIQIFMLHDNCVLIYKIFKINYIFHKKIDPIKIFRIFKTEIIKLKN
jgi:hypothetical protein